MENNITPPSTESIEKRFPYPHLLSFWFWWLALTVVYLSLHLVGILMNHLSPFLGGFLGHVWGLIGLFVPIGFQNLTAFFVSIFGVFFGKLPVQFLTGILAPIIFLGALFMTDRFLFYKLKINSPTKKIALNLFLLFLLTLIIDLAIFHSWASFSIFLDGHPKQF